MKHLKVTSALLSAVMCMSMVMTPVSVMADESAPEETQVEETESRRHRKRNLLRQRNRNLKQLKIRFLKTKTVQKLLMPY